jgi:hypothetical protein
LAEVNIIFVIVKKNYFPFYKNRKRNKNITWWYISLSCDP